MTLILLCEWVYHTPFWHR